MEAPLRRIYAGATYARGDRPACGSASCGGGLPRAGGRHLMFQFDDETPLRAVPGPAVAIMVAASLGDGRF